jgi:hypothetical protein
MTSSERLGIRLDTITLQREFERTPLTIACPACDVGTLAIFLFLKTRLGLTIAINYHYVHAIELVDSIVAGRVSPDVNLVLLGVAQLAYLLGKRQSEYDLLTELPGSSFGLIRTRSSASNQPSKSSKFLLLDDIRSNSAFYLDEALESLGTSATKHQKMFKEPFEIAAHFAERSCDEQAVMFFPFLDFNCIFNDCQPIDVPATVRSGSHNFLLAHRSIVRNTKLARLLNGAIRYACLSLSEEASSQRDMTELIASDAVFLKFMKRASGAGYFSHHQSL